MQNLNYTSESRLLQAIQGDGTTYAWTDVSSLIVCSSLQEILAFSSSTLLASFPVQATNVYYTGSITQYPIGIENSLLSFGSASKLEWNFTIQGLDPKLIDQANYYITSSLINFGSSGSNFKGSQELIPDDLCTIVATGSGTYNATVYLYDLNASTPIPGVPGTLILTASSIDTGASASFYPSASTNYKAYIDIIGSYAP